MPRKWGKNEKAIVKNALIESGKKLFQAHGLQKTTVEDIAREARISKGAFYSFYDSKEELFVDIVEAAEREFREKVSTELDEKGKSHRESFKLFLEKTVDLFAGDRIFHQLKSGEMEILKRRLPKGKLPRDFASDPQYFSRYFRVWTKKGWMRKIKPAALNGLIQLLGCIALHKEDIDDSSYEAGKALMIDMISEYLITGD